MANIGQGNVINEQRIVAIIHPCSMPTKRLIEEAESRQKLIDATSKHRRRSVVVTDSDHIILSSVQPETLARRCGISVGIPYPPSEEK